MDTSELWHVMPDPVLLYIFSYLSAKDLLNVRRTCKNWLRLASDQFLWKRLFHVDFKIDRSIPIAPGKNSWLSEYKRLKYHTPMQQTEVLVEHTHQVLHVSFSHNGEMFASSSKDGYIKAHHARLCCNLTRNFTLQCRVLNKPYDIFGTWYTDDYLLSGRLHFLGHLVSCSALWLNKAWQESESEKKPIIKRLFKFYNRKASSIRTITVANCFTSDSKIDVLKDPQASHSSSEVVVHGNPVSRDALNVAPWPSGRSRTLELASGSFPQDIKVDFTAESKEACTMDSPIRYSQEYRRAESAEIASESSDDDDNTSSDFEDPLLPWDEEWSGLSEDESSQIRHVRVSRKSRTAVAREDNLMSSLRNDDEESDHETADSLEEDTSIEKILDPREKFLIFTTGSLTYTPHQIGFKRIKPFKFAERVTETPTLMQRLAERQERNHAPTISPNWLDEQSVMHFFDKIDHVIDLHGHIIGMGLSPDHRYLYVNSRPWPQNYVIENPLSPPPIAQEIDIHVIDLCTLKEVGTMLRSHKAYTPNDECFFIFLDVSDQYVASGAEDKHGYLWDRHYGNCLAKLPHSDVVNSVAFNPRDPEMLVTASDDFTLKVWRSKNRVKELNISMDHEMEWDFINELNARP
ncbi:F-box/WD repeat-containing protein 5-like [Stegodyphus dumicola]|uniref:F-box/WD repeat-containing protein 5-like n=1 Tax=Stegodyphus dumicola TaxID=202533 RepID=UPI0015AE61BD|nr:F-box/WD repeat-containing protein 5-like [Stegodyphus dumicola]